MFYRVIVLYSASTIIFALKRQKEGYLPKKKLSEEDLAARFVTIFSTYSRLMLISGSLFLPLSLRSLHFRCTPRLTCIYSIHPFAPPQQLA